MRLLGICRFGCFNDGDSDATVTVALRSRDGLYIKNKEMRRPGTGGGDPSSQVFLRHYKRGKAALDNLALIHQ